jgi:molybdopterin synthase catalytic subunit
MVQLKRSGVYLKGEIHLQEIIDLARQNPNTNRAGAMVTFTGIVRGQTHEGQEVERLEMEAYKELAEQALKKICEHLRRRKGVVDVLIHHLIGDFEVGEDLVYVVVLADSRNNAFSTSQEAVERYKKEAAIWKKEYLKDGSSHWVTE